MNRLSTLVMMIVLFFGTFALVRSGAANSATANQVTVTQANNAAFRDGLYLGKLAASRGDSFRVARGRWVNQSDRNSYASGYERGYNELLAKK